MEAALGLEPDEAPDPLLGLLEEVSALAGSEAAAEVATAYDGSESPSHDLSHILAVGRSDIGLQARFDRAMIARISNKSGAAVERGRSLAGEVRKLMGLPADSPITDGIVADLLGITQRELTDAAQASTRLAFGLMISDESGKDRILFKGSRGTSRRFDAARLVCDGLTYDQDRWHRRPEPTRLGRRSSVLLPLSFLHRFQGLLGYLRDDYSIDAIEGAAEYYDVSPLMAVSHLVNEGAMKRDRPAARMFFSARNHH